MHHPRRVVGSTSKGVKRWALPHLLGVLPVKGPLSKTQNVMDETSVPAGFWLSQSWATPQNLPQGAFGSGWLSKISVGGRWLMVYYDTSNGVYSSTKWEQNSGWSNWKQLHELDN